jgi:hypothetical protein
MVKGEVPRSFTPPMEKPAQVPKLLAVVLPPQMLSFRMRMSPGEWPKSTVNSNIDTGVPVLMIRPTLSIMRSFGRWMEADVLGGDHLPLRGEVLMMPTSRAWVISFEFMTWRPSRWSRFLQALLLLPELKIHSD